MSVSRRDFLKGLGGLMTGIIVSGSLDNSAHGSAPPIKIGVIDSNTGVFGTFGIDAIRSASIAVEKINSEGGVLGQPFQLLVRDDSGNPRKAVEQMKLLLGNDVTAVLGPSNTFANKEISDIAEKEGIPLFISNPFIGGLTTGTTVYTFRIQPLAKTLGYKVIEFLKEISKNKGHSIKTLGLFCDEYSPWKKSADNIQKLAHKKDLKVSFNIELPIKLSDVSPYLVKAKESNPDIILNFGWPWNLANIVGEMRKVGYYPKAMVGFSSLGISNPTYIAEKGDLFLEVMDINYWGNPKLSLTKNFKRIYKDKYQNYPSNSAFYTYTAIHVLKDAICYAKSIDRKKIAGMLKERTFNKYLLAQDAPIKFDQRGQNINAGVVLLQVFNPVPIVIFPPEYAEKKAVYPMTGGK